MLKTPINTVVFNAMWVLKMSVQGGQKEVFEHDIFAQISLIVEIPQKSPLPLYAVFARTALSQTPRTAGDLALPRLKLSVGRSFILLDYDASSDSMRCSAAHQFIRSVSYKTS